MHEGEDWSFFENLLPPIVGLIAIGALAVGVWALGQPGNQLVGATLSQCARIAENQARLACYDELAAPHQPARGALAPSPIHPRDVSQ
jgi:hypothetical protein